jgi:hypothetical protein
MLVHNDEVAIGSTMARSLRLLRSLLLLLLLPSTCFQRIQSEAAARLRLATTILIINP